MLSFHPTNSTSSAGGSAKEPTPLNDDPIDMEITLTGAQLSNLIRNAMMSMMRPGIELEYPHSYPSICVEKSKGAVWIGGEDIVKLQIGVVAKNIGSTDQEVLTR